MSLVDMLCLHSSQCKSENCGMCSFSNPIIKEQMNLFHYSEWRRGDQRGHSPQPAALLTIKNFNTR